MVETCDFSNTLTITNKETKQLVCKSDLLSNTNEYNLGIKLIFPKDKTSYVNELHGDTKQHTTIAFDTNNFVSGFNGTIQNCLVDTLLVAGSDTNHPDRGTDLESEVISSYISNNETLIHTCNFASERVKLFQNKYLSDNYIIDYKFEDKTDRSESDQTKMWVEDTSKLLSPTIESYKLTPQVYQLDTLSLQAKFVGSDGETVGLEYDTTLL